MGGGTGTGGRLLPDPDDLDDLVDDQQPFDAYVEYIEYPDSILLRGEFWFWLFVTALAFVVSQMLLSLYP